jgi:hypothetical protein
MRRNLASAARKPKDRIKASLEHRFKEKAAFLCGKAAFFNRVQASPYAAAFGKR